MELLIKTAFDPKYQWFVIKQEYLKYAPEQKNCLF